MHLCFLHIHVRYDRVSSRTYMYNSQVGVCVCVETTTSQALLLIKLIRIIFNF